jgi:hypothetical protein
MLCRYAQDCGLKVHWAVRIQSAQSGFCSEALERPKKWLASITFCQRYRARAMLSAPAPSSACTQWIRPLKFHGHDDLGLSTINQFMVADAHRGDDAVITSSSKAPTWQQPLRQLTTNQTCSMIRTVLRDRPHALRRDQKQPLLLLRRS